MRLKRKFGGVAEGIFYVTLGCASGFNRFGALSSHNDCITTIKSP